MNSGEKLVNYSLMERDPQTGKLVSTTVKVLYDGQRIKPLPIPRVNNLKFVDEWKMGRRSKSYIDMKILESKRDVDSISEILNKERYDLIQWFMDRHPKFNYNLLLSGIYFEKSDCKFPPSRKALHVLCAKGHLGPLTRIASTLTGGAIDYLFTEEMLLTAMENAHASVVAFIVSHKDFRDLESSRILYLAIRCMNQNPNQFLIDSIMTVLVYGNVTRNDIASNWEEIKSQKILCPIPNTEDLEVVDNHDQESMKIDERYVSEVNLKMQRSYLKYQDDMRELEYWANHFVSELELYIESPAMYTIGFHSKFPWPPKHLDSIKF